MFNLISCLLVFTLIRFLILIVCNKITIKNIFIGVLINLIIFILFLNDTLFFLENYFFLIFFFFFVAIDLLLAFFLIFEKFNIK